MGAFAILRLIELSIGAIATSLVLPALSRRHRQFRRKRAQDSLFFSVVLTDWLLTTSGIVHHAVHLHAEAVGTTAGHKVGGVVAEALFHQALLASLLWPAVLAVFVLTDGRPTFPVQAAWLGVWAVAGAYGALWTWYLQRRPPIAHSANAATGTLGPPPAVALTQSVVLALAALLILVTTTLVHRRRRRHPEAAKTQAPPRLRFLVLLLTLHGPFMLATWARERLPMAFRDFALVLTLLVPILNAIVYGSQPTADLMRGKPQGGGTGGRRGPHQRTTARTTARTNFTTTAEELLETMDPNMVTLEELDGLSDMTFLAEGASGSVYKARWLGIDVAMKLIKLPNAGDNADLYQTMIHHSEQAFIEEASICARLRHPNITLFIRAGHYEGKLGILTEYCARGSLKDVLKREFPLAWKRKVSLALHVAKGLTYLHARNPTYIHRDLKGSNILVTDTWQAKLADFGISKVSNFVKDPLETALLMSNTGTQAAAVAAAATAAMHTLNDITSFAGTWRWNAPEILQDPSNCRYSRSTDIYSFGMVLWEILSDGAIPFSSSRFDFEVRERVINGQRPQIKPSEGCPDAFINLILQCWAQHPGSRPTAAQASTQLTSILDSMGGKALPISESIDSTSDPSGVFSIHSDRGQYIRSTFGLRITNLFRNGSRFSQSLLGSSRSRSGDDLDDQNSKFSILGSPRSSNIRSTTSSGISTSSSNSSSGFGGFFGSRRRAFTRDTALPSLHEYDVEPNPSDTSTVASPLESAMSPIVELPMDAMLEDGHHTYLDKTPVLGGNDEASDMDYEDSHDRDDDFSVGSSAGESAGYAESFERDSERLRSLSRSQNRGYTMNFGDTNRTVASNRSGDTIVDASRMSLNASGGFTAGFLEGMRRKGSVQRTEYVIYDDGASNLADTDRSAVSTVGSNPSGSVGPRSRNDPSNGDELDDLPDHVVKFPKKKQFGSAASVKAQPRTAPTSANKASGGSLQPTTGTVTAYL